MIRNIMKFAWRNIRRNKRRTGLTILAIVIGMVSLVFGRSFINGMLHSMEEPIIKMQSGHIRLVHKEYLRLERVFPKDQLVAPVSGIEAILKDIPEIDSQSRLIKFRILAAHGEQNEACLAIGVYPEEAKRVMELDRFVKQGTFFSADGTGLIIGGKLAKKLGVTVGDELLLVTTDINYSTYALPFRIAGIFEIGFSYLDKNAVFIDFAKASEMMDYRDACQEILLMIRHPEQAPEIAALIQTKIAGNSEPGIQVIPWQENDIIKNTMPLVSKIYDGIFYMMMFIVGLVILNTMLMTVMERYHEIGIIKALGFKNRDVAAMIFTEAFYIGLIGSLLGGALGTALTAMTERTGIDMGQALNESLLDNMDIPISFFGKSLYPDLTLSIVIASVLFGIVTTLAAVIYPAWKSARMSPVEAFRSELKI
ncbi:MAG: FtsX-like permease family protein [Chrysiogenia bacterium]